MPDPKVKIRLEAEAALGAGIRQALGQIEGFSEKAKGLLKGAFAGLSIAGITEAVNKTLEFGDQLNKASIKSGIATKAFSELAYAARLSGVETDTLSTSFVFMQKALGMASTGAKEQNDALKALGLKLGDIKSLAPEKQFELFGDRISKLKDPTDKALAAVSLFGRAGANLLPLFEQGAEGIRKAREEAQKVGQSFSKEQLQKLTDAKDSVDRLKESFSALATTLLSKVAPAITRFFNDLTGITPATVPLQELMQQKLDMLARLPESHPERAKLQADIAALQRKIRLSSPPVTHNRGLTLYKPEEQAPPGFTDTAASAADAAAAEKAAFQKSLIPAFQRIEYEDFLKSNKDATDKWIRDTEDQSDALNSYVDQSFKDLTKKIEASTDQWSVYADQAARNMQDAFADFLFDPFKDGLDGMLKGFIDVIRRMIAEAAAAQIFGPKDKGGLGLGDIITGFVSGLFGGHRASGGPIVPGRIYTVGEHGAESFVSGVSGRIIPNAGGGVVINNYMDNRGATSEFIQAMPAILRANNEQLKSDIFDQLSRRGAR